MPQARGSDDRFTIESLLGAGSAAWVYRVREVETGSSYALKVLKEITDRSPQRLAEEGRLQASLRHPNLVAVYELVDFGGAPGLLMELVHGGSLLSTMRRGRVGLDEAERLFRGLLAGVGAAHAIGLIHRDLKPDNILLQPDPDGGPPTPKISDFGTARLQAADAGRTLTGMVIGTPAYMAPEQATAPRNVDARADLFSLGVVIFELCTGQRPTANGPIEPPTPLPQRLLQALQGCLAPDREARIPDAATALAVLDGHLPWPAPSGPEGAG